jgi:hypothetical protein
MDTAARQTLATYIQLEFDGMLADDQFSDMVSILKSSQAARHYYARTIAILVALRQSAAVKSHPTSPELRIGDSFDSDFWAALSQDEKEAKPLPVARVSEPAALITNVRERKAMLKTQRRKIPVSLWLSLTSLAAMLLMMAYVVLNPKTTYEVATVVDSLQTQWSSPLTAQKGTRLAAFSEPIVVHRGIVKIESDKGVQIILEAPATFRFLSADEIVLDHGRLLAFVPERGNGFSVQTSNSKIIDLGTKFGVYADMNNTTELHLFKGKTLLIAGKGQGSKQTAEVSSGRAVRVDYTGQAVTDVPLRADIFVHDIDSQTGLLWRGQRIINLADVVGDGCGFGTGVQGVGINPVSGVFRNAEAKTRKHSNVYTRVDSNIYVDGVFVPNGTDEQVVTSAGHIFKECPPTSGYFFMEISNTPKARILTDEQLQPLYLNQTNYSLKDNPSLFLHSNAGITFDLNQFRSRLPG